MLLILIYRKKRVKYACVLNFVHKATVTAQGEHLKLSELLQNILCKPR